jgi:ribosomal-protein-alanine N-acetyltransferase
VSTAPVEVATARLLLRRPRLDDASNIFERYAGDLEVTRFLAWPRHQSIRDTDAFLQFSEQDWERWPAGPYLIESRQSGELLGGTGLGFRTPTEAVTGYVLARDAWGHGYATEALAAVIEVADSLGVVTLSALCHAQHSTSQRVLEKCGFTRDGVCEIDFPNLSPVRQQALWT